MRDFFRKNTFIGGVEILFRLPLIFTAGYLARSVGPDAYGNWAVVIVYYGFMASVAGLGLSVSISRLAAVAPAVRARAYLGVAFRSTGVALLAAAALTLVFQPWLGDVLGVTTKFRHLFAFSSLLAMATVAEQLLDAYFKAQERLTRFVFLVLARTAIEIIAVLATFHNAQVGGPQAESLLATYVLWVVAMKVLVYPWLLAGRRGGGRGNIPLPPAERKEFLRYGLPMVPTALLAWFIAQGDRLVLSHQIDKSSLGIYAFSASLAANMVYIGYAVYPLLLPRASRLYEEGNIEELKTLFRRSQQLTFLLLSMVMLCLALFGREVLLWTAGEKFIGEGLILLVLAFAIGMDQVLGIHQYLFHLTKRAKWIFWLNLPQGIILLLAVWLSAAVGGIRWVPWGVLVGVLISNTIRYEVARRFLPIPRPDYLMTALAGLLAAAWAMAWAVQDIALGPRIAVAAGLSAVIFILLSSARRWNVAA